MNALHNLDLFAQATLSIVLEAIPFLLLGSVASGLVEAFVPKDRLERLLPKGRLASTLVGLGLGAVTPCCECGVVYLARRLIGKGVPPGAAVAFMLAAPVINPVSILATLVAFRGDPTMAVWRCALVILAGLVVGYWAGGQKAASLLVPLLTPAPACGCGHDHGPQHDHPTPAGGCSHDHGPKPVSSPGGSPEGSPGATPACGHDHGPRPVAAPSGVAPAAAAATMPGALFGSLADAVPLAAVLPTPRAKIASAMHHALADFLDMAKVLILGSMVAAAFKAYVPVSVVMAMENDLVLAIPGMMALAVILSLCSQADAFVAASFSTFPQAAKLAFLALGPMLDLKLMLMWRQVFTPRLVRVLTFVPAALVFLACCLLGIATGGAP
ncbi:permease [Desulfovibrio aerotolerans]|uniref:Permease n=1 Tax=Solidesulfovibrio aerotolerans TaxID=295255 RepID=A0A7C9J6L6_9BACT|nr:permease [Solidesulfovibrio aerotolerans]MYL81738.1 permease [Solidesulfovibrio aerotolerans]